jgi:DNA-binding transcriptional MerR regulator
MSARGIYSIGAVARMLGLSQGTIRSWEDRYGLIVAERSEGGRRIYTRDQVEALRFIQARLDEGLSAADAHRLLEEHQVGVEAVVQRPASNPRGRRLILLAERDRYAAQLNEVFLRTEGYDVDVALSAQDAEEKFDSHHPAVTILELTIGGGDGRRLCERLKQRRATPLLTISTLDLREQALAAGADAFLQKPLEPRQLASAVRDLLGDVGATREQSFAAR